MFSSPEKTPAQQRIHAHVFISGENTSPATPTGENSTEKNTGRRFDVMLPSERKTCYIFVHASPPESPGQEKNMPHEPDTVPQHLHEFTLMSSPKGKTSYTLFVLAFFFGEKGSEEKTWGITIKISEPEQEKPFVCNPSEKEAQKKTPIADLFIPLNIWNGMEIRGDSHERKTRAE